MNKNNKHTLIILAGVFAIAQLDRQIVSISLDAIGTEFSLSNSQLGLFSGLLFAIIFVTFGFPIAKLSARGNRRNIVSISTLVWSVFTVAMAGAQNIAHLILARLGVAIGEAGAIAPAHSMIADLYPKEKRTSAMAFFAAGGNVGILLAMLVGGIGGHFLGWRWAFVIAGIPGILLALLLRFGTGEPERDPSKKPPASFRKLLIGTSKTIATDIGLRHAFLAFSITGVVTFGAIGWTPTFLIRNHNLNPAQVGIYLALAIGVAGGLGTALSGKLADRWGARHAKWRIGVVVLAILLAKPFVIAFLMIEHTTTALLIYIPAVTVAGAFWGPTFAYMYAILPPEQRPMGTAIFLFGFNLIGLGLGPTAVGVASDFVFAGEHALSSSLIALQLVGFWGAWHYWQVMKRIPADA